MKLIELLESFDDLLMKRLTDSEIVVLAVIITQPGINAYKNLTRNVVTNGILSKFYQFGWIDFEEQYEDERSIVLTEEGKEVAKIYDLIDKETEEPTDEAYKQAAELDDIIEDDH
jgi:hypothetical protein